MQVSRELVGELFNSRPDAEAHVCIIFLIAVRKYHNQNQFVDEREVRKGGEMIVVGGMAGEI